MRRAYYSSSITDFLPATPNAIIGELTRAHARNLEQTQLNAWLEQITILKRVLTNRSGRIYFEYAIPRMGKRIDVVLLIGPVIFVLEFKVGESHFTSSALDQVTDYCLDLKNFHETSLNHIIAPVLIATASCHTKPIVCETRSGALRADIDRDSSRRGSSGQGSSGQGSSERGSSPTVREGSPLPSGYLPGALLDSRATAPLATWLPDDKVLSRITSTVPQLDEVIDRVLRFAADKSATDFNDMSSIFDASITEH